MTALAFNVRSISSRMQLIIRNVLSNNVMRDKRLHKMLNVKIVIIIRDLNQVGNSVVQIHVMIDNNS